MRDRGLPGSLAGFARRIPAVAIPTLAGLFPLVIGAGGHFALGFDTAAYVRAADALARGVSPYEPGARLGAWGAYWYSPAAALPFAPLRGLPVEVLTWLLALASLATLAWVLVTLGGGGWRGALVALVGTASFAAWPVTVYGNLTTLVAALLGLFFVARLRDRAVPAGLALAAGALLKVTPGLLALGLLSARSWRALGTGALALLGAVAATLVLFPDAPGAWRAFPSVVAGVTSQVVPFPSSLSLPDLLAANGIESGGLRLGLGVGGAAALVVAGRLGHPVRMIALATIGLQIASSLAWVHYALLWLPAYAALCGAQPDRRSALLALGGIVVLNLPFFAPWMPIGAFVAYWSPLVVYPLLARRIVPRGA